MAEEIIKYPDMAEKIAKAKQEHDNKEQKEIDDRKAKYQEEFEKEQRDKYLSRIKSSIKEPELTLDCESEYSNESLGTLASKLEKSIEELI